VGYWRSRHADAVKRIEQLKDELDQAQGQIRSLQAKLFGRKSEKSACRDRSNVLFDPEDTSAAAKKRGADSTSAVSPDVRLRSRAANAGGPAAAEADPQGQLRHLDLGACVVG
jgi:TolA-binding protein